MPDKAKDIAIIYSKHAGQFESYRIELDNIISKLSNIMLAGVSLFELETVESKLNIQDFQAIFVMGGDGSVGRVLGMVARHNATLQKDDQRRVPVGIIPGGTGNIFAECLGLMKKDRANLIEYALNVIGEKRTVKLDIGIANGTPFVIDVGIGPFATAITKPDSEDKFHQGMLSYIKPLFRALRKRPYKFRITADGESFVIKASGLFVSNPPEIGIGQDADLSGIQDGYLDLCIMDPEEVDDYFRIAKKYGAWFLAGITVDDTPYKVFKVKEVTIEALEPSKDPALMNKVMEVEELPLEEKIIDGSRELKAMLDGDPFEFTPLEISIMPGAVDVFVSSKIQETSAAIADRTSSVRVR